MNILDSETNFMYKNSEQLESYSLLQNNNNKEKKLMRLLYKTF